MALVPTMGALHAGHLALVRLARRRADRVVVSIFVNPAQFAPNEDFWQLSANLGRRHRGAVGASRSMRSGRRASPQCIRTALRPGSRRADRRWPALKTSSARISSAASARWWPSFCCRSRPDFATFGEKDYQQLKVVTAMARDLDIPTKIVGLPTVREKDGLAMSSRNAYLSAGERAAAPALYRVLKECAAQLKAGPAACRNAWRRPRRRSSARALRWITSRRATPKRWRRSPRSRMARCGCWWRPSSAAPG